MRKSLKYIATRRAMELIAFRGTSSTDHKRLELREYLGGACAFEDDFVESMRDMVMDIERTTSSVLVAIELDAFGPEGT